MHALCGPVPCVHTPHASRPLGAEGDVWPAPCTDSFRLKLPMYFSATASSHWQLHTPVAAKRLEQSQTLEFI